MKTVSSDNPGTSVSLAWWNRMTEFCNPAWCHDWSLSSAFNVWSRSKWPALIHRLISVWVEQCRRMLSKPLHNAFFVIKGKVCSLVVFVSFSSTCRWTKTTNKLFLADNRHPSRKNEEESFTYPQRQPCSWANNLFSCDSQRTCTAWSSTDDQNRPRSLVSISLQVPGSVWRFSENRNWKPASRDIHWVTERKSLLEWTC